MPNFEPCKNCGHDIGCGCEYRLVNGIECCDFCYLTIQEPVIEQKNIIEIHEEQFIDTIPSGISDEIDNEESEIL